MKIYLIRHGLTELNKKKLLNGQINEPLAPEGFEQAKIVATLIPKTVTNIYASSMLRAKQTAKTVNGVLKVPIYYQDELRETHMGAIAGQSWADMKSGMDLKKKHRSMQFDYRDVGGESAEDFKNRVVGFMSKINGKYDDYEVLVVGHGGIIRLLHLLEHEHHQQEDLEHASLLEFDLDRIIENSNKK